MRCAALFLALAWLLSFGDALHFPVPEPTPCEANEVDPWGWTPRTTSSPGVFGVQRRQGSLTQTCAWYGDQALTCGGPDFCFYLYSQPYMGCCPVDSSGDFTSCVVATTCVNQEQSSAECGLQGCSASWAICGAPSHYPECITYELIAGIATYSSFGCDTSSTYYVLSTTPSTPSTVSTTTTSSTSSQSTSTPITSPSSSSTSLTSLTSSSTTPNAPASTSPIGPTPTPGPNHHIAAIVGGVVGGIAGLALIIGAISFIIYRVRKKRDETAYDDAPEMTGYVQS